MRQSSAALQDLAVIEANAWVVDHDRLIGEETLRQSTLLGWVNANPFQRRDGRGDVWLVRSNTVLGRLAGQVKLGDGSAPGTEKRVRLQCLSPSATVVHAVTDRAGRFGVDLPAGRYRVALDQRGVEPDPMRVVELSAGATAQVELTAPPLTGRAIFGSRGIRVSAAGMRAAASSCAMRVRTAAVVRSSGPSIAEGAPRCGWVRSLATSCASGRMTGL